MRETIHQFCQWSAKRFSINSLHNWTGQPIIMPFYHSIKGDEPLPHIQRLYEPRTKAQFEADIDFFLQHYRPIGLHDLLTILKHDEWPSEPSFFLSFDDGLREVYDIVMPLLLQKGVPATVFLNTDFVDNKALFYRYKLSLLQNLLATKQLTKKQVQAVGKLLDLQAPENALIEEVLVQTTHSNRQLLDQVAEKLELDFSDFLQKQRPYLTVNQVREMMSKGFTFGAHSCNHPQYADMNLVAQLQQTKDSLRFVRRQFNIRYKAFSFPFTDDGVGANFFETVAADKIADITFGCAGLKDQEEDFPFHFQRIPMERFSGTAEEYLKGEYFYFLLKSMVGRNVVDR